MHYLYKILSIIILLFSPLCGFAINEKSDTLLHTTTPAKLLITESSEGTKIVVTDSLTGKSLGTVITEYTSDASIKTDAETGWGNFRNRLNPHNFINFGNRKSSWGVSMQGICLGLTNATGQGQPGGLQWSKSFEISWLSCINLYYAFGNNDISLGLGFDWRNYKITSSDRCLVANANKGIEWGEYPKDGTPRYSRLKIFSLQMPLLYHWSIPKSSLNLRFGPIMNFNTYGSLLTVWDDVNGNRMEDFTKAIAPRRFTVDFFGSLSLNNLIGIYVRYSPMKVMDASPSLNFHPLSVGITIGI